jgi:hypothetical protein
MSFNYYVAVHQANWPTVAALNQCIASLGYPLVVNPTSPEELAKPFHEMPGTVGLKVTFEGGPVELEASIVQLSPSSPYAFGLSPTLPKTNVIGPGGTTATLTQMLGAGSFVPKDLNADLRAVGVKSPDFKDGDYVLTITFRSSVVEYRAGAFLMAGLIKCANGLGFEFEQGTFGADNFADALAQEAKDPPKQK